MYLEKYFQDAYDLKIDFDLAYDVIMAYVISKVKIRELIDIYFKPFSTEMRNMCRDQLYVSSDVYMNYYIFTGFDRMFKFGNKLRVEFWKYIQYEFSIFPIGFIPLGDSTNYLVYINNANDENVGYVNVSGFEYVDVYSKVWGKLLRMYYGSDPKIEYRLWWMIDTQDIKVSDAYYKLEDNKYSYNVDILDKYKIDCKNLENKYYQTINGYKYLNSNMHIADIRKLNK